MAITVDVISQLDEEAIALTASRIRIAVRDAVRAGIRDGIREALHDLYNDA
jgi:hypothetical protein